MTDGDARHVDLPADDRTDEDIGTDIKPADDAALDHHGVAHTAPAPTTEEEDDWEHKDLKNGGDEALARLTEAKNGDADDEAPIKAAARKCERIMEALEAVQNKQMRTALEERLAKAERELDQMIEFGQTQYDSSPRLGRPSTIKSAKSPKVRTTESVKSRFKGVYGVRSLKKGSIRWTAKLLKDNTWYRDGSYTDEEEAARAVDARLRAWGRDDECNFDDAGAERPARERKHGSSKRRAQQPLASDGPKRHQVVQPSIPVHPLQLQQTVPALFQN